MRFVVMSMGSIGLRHLKNIRSTFPNADIAVWRRATTADNDVPAGANYLCRSFEDVCAFSPDVAVIASPASVHLEVGLRLAARGVHLFIEKPLSISAHGVDELLKCCDAHNVVLMVGYNLRFMPSLIRARELVISGLIGDVVSARVEIGQYLPEWRTGTDYRNGVTASSELGGGVLLELSHDIDYLLWILGLPDRLSAVGGKYSNLDLDVEDLVEILLQYERPRRLVSVHLDMLRRSPARGCTFLGTQGVITWDCIADKVTYYNSAERCWSEVNVTTLHDRNNVYIDQLQCFVASLTDSNKMAGCTGVEALQVLKVVDAARDSMRFQRTVNLMW